MPEAIVLSGSVTLSNPPIPAAGAHILLLCDGCTGPAASRPVAEAVVEPSGEFKLVVPDPGIQTSSNVRNVR